MLGKFRRIHNGYTYDLCSKACSEWFDVIYDAEILLKDDFTESEYNAWLEENGNSMQNSQNFLFEQESSFAHIFVPKVRSSRMYVRNNPMCQWREWQRPTFRSSRRRQSNSRCNVRVQLWTWWSSRSQACHHSVHSNSEQHMWRSSKKRTIWPNMFKEMTNSASHARRTLAMGVSQPNARAGLRISAIWHASNARHSFVHRKQLPSNVKWCNRRFSFAQLLLSKRNRDQDFIASAAAFRIRKSLLWNDISWVHIRVNISTIKSLQKFVTNTKGVWTKMKLSGPVSGPTIETRWSVCYTRHNFQSVNSLIENKMHICQ